LNDPKNVSDNQSDNPPAYTTLYLSPHLDDAALSCGGAIAAQSCAGERVLIVSIMAGDPPAGLSAYAAGLHARWQLASDATAARRAEDLAACAHLGADARHWTLPDCIYRLDAAGRPFYRSDADIFGTLAPAERIWVARLAAQMRALPPAPRIVVPLGVGNHVDHQLTRLAAEQAFAPARLEYYEDYPYAQQQPGVVAALLENRPGMWTAAVIPVDAVSLRAKFDAVTAYQSQLSTFFRDRADLEAQIGGYMAQIGGERRLRRAVSETLW
jgi:LmbE family N-acetylglucosaminyl deacetylase